MHALAPHELDVVADQAAPDTQPRARAQLLEYRRGRFVAFPLHTTLELLERPTAVRVPGAPYYGCGLIAWQGRHLPLIDLHTLMRAYPEDHPPHAEHALVLAYQRASGQQLEYGAVCAPSLVR